MSTELKTIIDRYGEDAQIDICIEECSELTKALLKMRRYGDIPSRVPDLRKDVIEEIADVLVTLEQLTIIFDCEQEVLAVAEYKINRQIERIKNELNDNRKE